MQTFEEQKAFFDEQWPGMKHAVETGGVAGVFVWMDGFEDPLQRRVLSLFARQGLALGEWEGKDLGVYAEVIRAAVERILDEGEASGDAGKLRKSKELANVITYNLSADLADCWPGPQVDGDARVAGDPAHFEAGLAAARRCVAWREELDKGPAALSMALWAEGMHAFSLRRTDEAVRSFEASLGAARDAEIRDAGIRDAGADEPGFAVTLGRGYLGLAKWRRGDGDGKPLFAAALQAFEKQLGDEDAAEDARFGIDQLETVRHRYLAEEG